MILQESVLFHTDGEAVSNLLKFLYFFLIVLYVAGAIYVLLTNKESINCFYVATLVAALLSLYGFYKKNKLIHFLIVPGGVRIFLYFKNGETTIGMSAVHILITLIPIGVTYLINKERFSAIKAKP